MSDCQFYVPPTPEEMLVYGLLDTPDAARDAPDVVLGCERPRTGDLLYFFVPVQGGAVRVRVCPFHAEYLARLYGADAQKKPPAKARRARSGAVQ